MSQTSNFANWCKQVERYMIEICPTLTIEKSRTTRSILWFELYNKDIIPYVAAIHFVLELIKIDGVE